MKTKLCNLFQTPRTTSIRVRSSYGGSPTKGLTFASQRAPMPYPPPSKHQHSHWNRKRHVQPPPNTILNHRHPKNRSQKRAREKAHRQSRDDFHGIAVGFGRTRDCCACYSILLRDEIVDLTKMRLICTRLFVEPVVLTRFMAISFRAL